MGFNIFFKEPIVIVKPTHLLESLNIDEINASWIGRFLYRDGDRWKILKVAELLGCRGHC